MIATSIALAIWTTGLLYMTTRTEKKRLLEAEIRVADDKGFEAETAVIGDGKV